MWNIRHDNIVRKHVDALAGDIARSVNGGKSVAVDARAFLALQECITRSTQRALLALAAEINAAVPVNRLPPELMSSIAVYLPFPDIVRCSMVCRQWRRLLVADVRLWCDLGLSFEAETVIWASWLATLLERSRRFPARIQLWWPHSSPASAILPSLPHIAVHMDHIVELSFNVVPALVTQFITLLRDHSAPVLEILRVSIRGPDARTGTYLGLPSQILGGYAPRLRHLQLSNTILSPASCPALASVRTLTYVHSGFNAPVSMIVSTLAGLPSLTEFTMLGRILPDPAPVPVAALHGIRTLRMQHSPAVHGRLAVIFPNLATSCIAFAVDTPASILVELVEAHAPITQLEIRADTIRGDTRAAGRLPGVNAVIVNGACVAVDVPDHALAVLTRAHLAGVRRCTLPVAFLPLLREAWPSLKHLEDLALHITAPPGALEPLPDNGAPFHVLRIVAYPATAAMFTGAHVRDWVKTLNDECERAPLRRLVLCGMPTVETEDLRGLAAEVSAEDVPAAQHLGLESWFWTYDSAMMYRV